MVPSLQRFNRCNFDGYASTQRRTPRLDGLESLYSRPSFPVRRVYPFSHANRAERAGLGRLALRSLTERRRAAASNRFFLVDVLDVRAPAVREIDGETPNRFRHSAAPKNEINAILAVGPTLCEQRSSAELPNNCNTDSINAYSFESR